MARRSPLPLVRQAYKKVREAYKVLNKKEKRQKYDQLGEGGLNSSGMGGGVSSEQATVREARGSLETVISALRRGVTGSIESAVPAIRHVVPAEMLPTTRVKDLELDEVLLHLCKSGGLSCGRFVLESGAIACNEAPPTVGGLAMLWATPLQLGPFVKEQFVLPFDRSICKFDADGLSLVPRAVVQYQHATKGTPHYVMFTNRPHYPTPPDNSKGNRCALHCALMAIGVTDSWQQQSPFTKRGQSDPHKPVTRYDDYPTPTREAMSHGEFVSALTRYNDMGDKGQVCVLCDVRNGPQANGVPTTLGCGGTKRVHAAI